METITDTKERRVTANLEDGFVLIKESESFVPRGYVRRQWGMNRVTLTRAEIAALAAKFPVEGKPVDPGVLEACREMLAAIEIEGADSVRLFDARNSALAAIAAAEGKPVDPGVLYESTGEVRQPQDGELFISMDPAERNIPRSLLVQREFEGCADGPRVIMRKVEEK